MVFYETEDLKHLEDRLFKKVKQISNVLKLLVLILIVIALARPQTKYSEKVILSEGVDIAIALDVSESMNAEDIQPKNRFAVAKKTTQEFIDKRPTDRLSLVVFGADAYPLSPLTLNHGVIKAYLARLTVGSAGDGTAIGTAIAAALNRLKGSTARSKVIVLLTDGENNRGIISPKTAAQLAKDMNIKINRKLRI